ncbi:calcium-dependent protein kinase 2 [Centropristis striata]|uniref:calcium-dependent protein kinase 2 n=1 Tax=Centropristis striata TaxID=184440 RepID=UPI0027DF0A49|nr:calcium-dependent protein kinase 2 [Centropristis striata]
MMHNGQLVAVKKVPVNLMTHHDMDREYQIYRKAAHPNIVKLVEKPRIHSDNKWYIIMEYISGETLEKIMFNQKLTHRIKSKIITGLCEGLFHLHNNDIVHQDLKPDNIMVKSDTNEAVIIDLGFAKVLPGWPQLCTKYWKHSICSSRDPDTPLGSARLSLRCVGDG